MVAIDNSEIPLSGGRLTLGVVRVGDTVRRPAGKHSRFVAELLRHLAALEVTWAPRYLGQDARERDMLTFLPGDVPPYWGTFTDSQVAAAGRLLRAFHDATRGSALAGSGSVVCHHDFGPNNAVFVAGRPVAVIDFDLAAPGEPLEDLGYAAWAWCISSKSLRLPVREQAEQVRILLSAYGDVPGATPAAVVDAIIERQQRNARFWSNALKHPEAIATPSAKIADRIVWSLSESVFVSVHRRLFEAALTSKARC
jgi:hypothetical protein